MRALETVQARGRAFGAAEVRYWGELKTWKQEAKLNGKDSLPDAVMNSDEPPPASKAKPIRRIQKTAGGGLPERPRPE